MAQANTQLSRKRRHTRVRTKVSGTIARPRLCVFRSLKYIYAQIIDDSAGHTLVSANSLEQELREKMAEKTKVERAELVGSLVAQRALNSGISKVVFDRGGYKYHGRVKALAEAARKACLDF